MYHTNHFYHLLNFISFCFILITITGCNQKDSSSTQSHPGLEILNITPTTDKGNKVNSSFLIEDDFRYVKLGTDSSYIIEEITRLISHAGKFYIFDAASQRIMIFNEDGSFNFQVNKKGRGPGEYLELEDFMVSPIGEIFILDQGRKAVLKYDSMGRFERSFNINKSPLPFRMSLLDDQFVFSHNNYASLSEKHYNITITDHQGNVKTQLMPTPDELVNKLFEGGFYTYNTTVNLIQSFSDTLYSVGTKAITPRYVINFESSGVPSSFLGKHTVTELMRKLLTSDFAFLPSNFCETDQVLSFQFMYKRMGNIVYFSKETNNMLVVGSVHDDLYSGFEIDSTPLAAIDNQFISVIPAYKMVEKYKAILDQFEDTKALNTFKQKHSKFVDIAEKTRNLDNPVLLIGRFKAF